MTESCAATNAPDPATAVHDALGADVERRRRGLIAGLLVVGMNSEIRILNPAGRRLLGEWGALAAVFLFTNTPPVLAHALGVIRNTLFGGHVRPERAATLALYEQLLNETGDDIMAADVRGEIDAAGRGSGDARD